MAQSTATELIERHRPTLDAAVAAAAQRGYWSAYPESPSPRVYGETAAAEGLAAYEAYLSGTMTDRSWDDAEIQASVARALSRLPALS